ncbi:MAG: type VI secretion system contractile sheath large subunit, partial [Methylococcaceae bacterium]
DNQSRFYCCGDFCGQTASSPITDKIVKIDMDNFDAVMAKFSPTLTLSSSQVLVFKELDDFHPDRLVAILPEFVELRRLKHGLDNPQTAAAIAAEIWQTYQPKATESSADTATDSESMTDTLERLLDRKTTFATPEIKSKNTVDELLYQLISPVIVADTLPEYQALSVFIDSVMADLMNTILHNPEFQALESIWRSVYALLFNEDADENQSFYLVNISKQALLTDMCNGMASSFANLLVNHGIKTVDSVIIGNYYFSGNAEDLALLGLLGMLAGQLHSRFISAVDEVFVKEQILGEEPLTIHWQSLRQSPAADFIGFCYPRILLRLPYGKKREPVETFVFEEFNDLPQHEQLSWGNPAFGFARLLVRQQTGYQGNGANDIESLPALVCLKDDEQHLYACGEWFLSEQNINKLLTAGIMPFISFHNRNSVRLIASQSLKL